MNSIDEIKSLKNKELVQLYELLVKVDYAAPDELPQSIKRLNSLGVNKENLAKMIVKRMKKAKNLKK